MGLMKENAPMGDGCRQVNEEELRHLDITDNLRDSDITVLLATSIVHQCY